MKKFFLLIVGVITTSAIQAQDIIVMKNADEVQAKVTAVTTESISYKKWSNLEGPTYTIFKSDIFYIKYQNGEKEVVQSIAKPTCSNKITNKLVADNLSKVKFQGYTYVGADFNSSLGGPSLDFSFGARTSKYLYIGGGIGWHNLLGEIYISEYNDRLNDYIYYYTFGWFPYLTFTSDIKGYIPTSSEFFPRIDLSFGGCVFPADGGICGFYMSFGAGFDWRRFSFGMGYQMPVVGNKPIPLGYARLGIRFGKR